MKQLTIYIQTSKRNYRGIDLLNIVSFRSYVTSNKKVTMLGLVTKDHGEINITERFKGKSMFLFETILEYLENPNRKHAIKDLFSSIKTYNNAIWKQYQYESAREFLNQQSDIEHKYGESSLRGLFLDLIWPAKRKP